MIPKFIEDQLNEQQKHILRKFIHSLPLMEEEEECTVGSPLTFEIRDTGIDTQIVVKSCGRSVYLDHGMEL